jgi:hypothetical protein
LFREHKAAVDGDAVAVLKPTSIKLSDNPEPDWKTIHFANFGQEALSCLVSPVKGAGIGLGTKHASVDMTAQPIRSSELKALIMLEEKTGPKNKK